MSDSRVRLFYFIAINMVLSFSCISYELILAQTSSVVLGGTLINYSLTICIYVASLGLGSLLLSYFPERNRLKIFFLSELGLSFLAPLIPILAFALGPLLSPELIPGQHMGIDSLLGPVIYGLGILVGVAAGFELPLLIDYGKKAFNQSAGVVLGTDYLGTLAGILFFPWLLSTTLGLLGTAAVAGLGNWFGALLIFRLFKTEIEDFAGPRTLFFLLSAPAALNFTLLTFEPYFREKLGALFSGAA